MATSQEITSLVNATNNLLAEVTGQKDRLTSVANTASQKAIEANASAMQAESAETASIEQVRIAKNEADRAKTEADKAKQITGLDTVEAAVAKALAETAQYSMTKAEFFALAEQRKADNAGSGFLEFGKHYHDQVINQGLWTTKPPHSYSTTLRMGRKHTSDGATIGTSKSNYAAALVNGVRHAVVPYQATNSGDGAFIKFPPAPNGTKTYDSATGIVVDHNIGAIDHNDAVDKAFKSEADTNKVITTRKDLVFLESWHEDLSVNDIVNPYGNVQYGSNNWNSINLQRDIVPQGYSAFGEWDTETNGWGARWSTLTDVQRTKFLQDPLNNIYYDTETNKYIQVKYRIRVVEGLGDEWVGANYDPRQSLNYKSGVKVTAQGQLTTSLDYIRNNSGRWFYANKSSDNSVNTDITIRSIHKKATTTSVNAQHYALPICLVQRLNQGAYHPIHNPFGCTTFAYCDDSSDKVNMTRYWYQISGKINNISQCFKTKRWDELYNNEVFAYSGAGYVGNGAAPSTGRSDQYKYFDAIYVGLVEDLRLSARKQDYSRLLEGGIRKAVSGETRGKDKVPFTKVFNTAAEATAEGYAVQVESGGKYVAHKWLSSEFDSLPWVDIIGTPENIAATFPNGVVGQWIPQIPDGTSKEWKLNRKCSVSQVRNTFSNDNGVTFNTEFPQPGFSTTTNSFIGMKSESNIGLIIYEALSNFTASANNSVVLGDLGKVYSTCRNEVFTGNRLACSLCGVVTKSSHGINQSYDYLTNSLIVNDGTLSGNTYGAPRHQASNVGTPNNGSKAVKTLYTLTSENGLLYMQYHGNELKYKADVAEGTDPWGDTKPATPLSNAYGIVPIISGEGTKEDLNGNTVKTFCHQEMIPCGIADTSASANAQNIAVTLPVYPNPDDNNNEQEQGTILPMHPVEPLN